MSEQPHCQLCGEPMPKGEEMFNYHGFSGPCPASPINEPSQRVVTSCEKRTATDEQLALDAFERHKKDSKPTVTITGLWLRRIGKYAQVLVEVDGRWRLVCQEIYDGQFSHITEATGGGARWPLDVVTENL